VRTMMAIATPTAILSVLASAKTSRPAAAPAVDPSSALVRSGHVMVYERACEREWCSNYTSQKLELLRNSKYRDIGTKTVNRYTDQETVSRIATFGKWR